MVTEDGGGSFERVGYAVGFDPGVNEACQRCVAGTESGNGNGNAK